MLTIKNIDKLLGYRIEFTDTRYIIDHVMELPDHYKIYLRVGLKTLNNWVATSSCNCINLTRETINGFYALDYGSQVIPISDQALSDILHVPIAIAPMLSSVRPYSVYDPGGYMIGGGVTIGQQLWSSADWTTGPSWTVKMPTDCNRNTFTSS